MTHGLILAAPSSGSGKTTLTLGILRALSRAGIQVRGAKSGPDYIDPRFHEAACGQTCPNLDAWAMPLKRLKSLAQGEGILLIEGAMGLFDGAPPTGKGATADLARNLGLPVVLVVDASHMAQSIAALVAGFAQHDPQVKVAGLILNKVGSPRHETMLRTALQGMGVPVLGVMHRQVGLEHPSRHLGLVQASERSDLAEYLDRAADAVEVAIDLTALCNLATPLPDGEQPTRQTPPAQNIAIASDRAFAFAYPHILNDWRNAGASIQFFSPLANEAPHEDAGFIFLPGGYPELYAETLAKAEVFKAGMRAATCPIYGECGGFMTLGEELIDAQGTRHEMLGLLHLETSFAKRKLHLGYRHLTALTGPFQGAWNAHEFHYASILKQDGPPLFKATDAEGTPLADMGLQQGSVFGSFAHLIEPQT